VLPGAPCSLKHRDFRNTAHISVWWQLYKRQISD